MKTKYRIVWQLGLLSILILVLTSCGGGAISLTYRVGGTAGKAHITYIDATGATQDEVVYLPWETTI